MSPTKNLAQAIKNLDQDFAARNQYWDERARERDMAVIAGIRRDIDELPDIADNKGRFSYEARSEVGRNIIEGLLARRYNREGVAPISTEPVVVAPFAPTAPTAAAAAPAAPTAAVAAPAAVVAPAAAPAAAASTRASISQQIAALEDRRGQMLALTKVPAAKAEADLLGDRIKDLREQLKPTEIAKLEREIDQFRADGASDTDPRIKTRLDKIAKLSTPTSERFGTDREAVSLEVYDKPFSQLTQAQRAAVNKRVEEEQGRKAEKGAAKFTLPGADKLADIPAFRASVQRTIEPQLKSITAADQALTAINDSLATGNFASYRAAQVQFARAIAGAGDLSQKELKAAGADPSLLGGAADVISTAFTSTPSEDTQKKIRSTLRAIITVSRKQAKDEVDQQRKIALRSPGYNADAVNEALRFPQLEGGTVPTPAVTGGDLAAAAAAELARRRGGK